MSAHEFPRAKKAVIPAAGLGTRFLPATKAVPKEMLNVVDRPVLQYIVEEAADAGLRDVLLITGRGKAGIVDHFDRQPYLESLLEERGDGARRDGVRRTAELAEIFTCRQAEPLGLGDAISCAASHVGAEPFAVLLGDEFVEPDKPLLPTMIDLQAHTGGIVVALIEVAWEEAGRYGIASVEPADDDLLEFRHGGRGLIEPVRITGLVEKPRAEEAPSNLAIVGRYVLPATIFDALRRIKPGAGGELQLTDAIALLLAEGTPAHGVVYRGIRYDTGQPIGYLQTVVRLATQHKDVGAEFAAWLRKYVANELVEVTD